MKTSNILILVTSFLFLSVTLCSNFVLKKQFDQIDKNDPYYGFSKDPIKPFHYIRLTGKGFGLTEIAQGPKSEIRMITEAKYLEWKVSGDTLVVTYKADWNQGYITRGGAYGNNPSVYITAPQLKGIMSDEIRCKVTNFKFQDLFVNQKGDGLLLNGASVDNLTARISANGYFMVNSKSTIGNADIEVRDSSAFSAENDVFKVIDLEIDSSAFVRIPGSI